MREILEITVPTEIFVEKKTTYKIAVVTVNIGNERLKNKSHDTSSSRRQIDFTSAH